MKIYIQLLVVLFFVSCKSEMKQTDLNTSEKSYFDLAKVVQEDIDDNTVNKCREEKNVMINGKNESRQTDTVIWQNELQLLMECDLNKPSWKGKYDVQMLNGHTKYVYTANTSKIPIRSLTVNYERQGGKVVSVEIEKKIATALFSNRQQIVYMPKQSFRIKSTQSALFMKDFNSEVEIKYLCNN